MPKKRSNKKKRKVKAVVVVPPDAAEVEVELVMPAALEEEPDLSWQAKGRRFLIRAKNLVLKEMTP